MPGILVRMVLVALAAVLGPWGLAAADAAEPTTAVGVVAASDDELLVDSAAFEAAPSKAPAAVSDVTYGPAGNQASGVVSPGSYRPDFARPPPTAAESYVFDTPANFSDPAADGGRVRRAALGLGSHRVAPRGVDAATDILRYDPDFAVGQIARRGNASASDLVDFGASQGWRQTQTATGPIKFVDENGVTRLTIKNGSPRAPGSGSPHIEIRNAAGGRIDVYGNPVTRRSPGNHTPIIWDLGS